MQSRERQGRGENGLKKPRNLSNSVEHNLRGDDDNEDDAFQIIPYLMAVRWMKGQEGRRRRCMEGKGTQHTDGVSVSKREQICAVRNASLQNKYSLFCLAFCVRVLPKKEHPVGRGVRSTKEKQDTGSMGRAR